MSARRIIAIGAALGFLLLGIGCGGSSYTTAPPPPPPPPPAPAPFATTVSDLVKNHTNDTESPASLDALNLSGSDVEDPHEFDEVLGIH